MMVLALRPIVALLSLIIGLLSLVMSVWYPSLAVRFGLRSRLRPEEVEMIYVLQCIFFLLGALLLFTSP